MEICSELVDNPLQVGIQSHCDMARVTDERQEGEEETEMKQNNHKLKETKGTNLRVLENSKMAKHHLQGTEEKHKTGTCINENQIKHILNILFETNEFST